MNEEKLNNRQLKDNTSKLIFGDAILYASFHVRTRIRYCKESLAL